MLAKFHFPIDSIIVVPSGLCPMKAMARPSRGTSPYFPLSMKTTCPPLQFIFVGFESNQQGHAASQEQASSRSPETFHGVFFSSADAAATAPAKTSIRMRNRFVRIRKPPLFERAKRI